MIFLVVTNIKKFLNKARVKLFRDSMPIIKREKTLGRKIAAKLTLFKMKDQGRLGDVCEKCNWRKITSKFSRYCTSCSKKVGKKGI